MLGVAGIAQGYLGAKRPAGELQRKGQCWSHVKPPDKRGGMESRLTAIESFECSAVGPVKGRASELAVYRRDFKARSMNYLYDFKGRGVILEILIVADRGIIERPASRIGEKGLRFYFRVYGLSKNVIEGEAKDE